MRTIQQVIDDVTQNEKTTLDLSQVDLEHASELDKLLIINCLEACQLNIILLPPSGVYALAFAILKSPSPQILLTLFEKIPVAAMPAQLTTKVRGESTFARLLGEVLKEQYTNCEEFLSLLFQYGDNDEFFKDMMFVFAQYYQDDVKRKTIVNALIPQWSQLSQDKQQQFFQDARFMELQILLLQQALENNDRALVDSLWLNGSRGNLAFLNKVCHNGHSQAFKENALLRQAVAELVRDECLIRARSYHLIESAQKLLGADFDVHVHKWLKADLYQHNIIEILIKNFLGQLRPETERPLLEWFLLLAIDYDLLNKTAVDNQKTLHAHLNSNAGASHLLQSVVTGLFARMPTDAQLESFIKTTTVAYWQYHPQLFMRILSSNNPQLLVSLFSKLRGKESHLYLQKKVSSDCSRFQYLLEDEHYASFVSAIYTAATDSVLAALSEMPALIPLFESRIGNPNVIIDLLLTRMEPTKMTEKVLPSFLFRLLESTISRLPSTHSSYQDLLRLGLYYGTSSNEGKKLLHVVVDSFTSSKRIAQPATESDLKFEIEQACSAQSVLMTKLSLFEARTTSVSMHRERYHHSTDPALTCQFCFDDIYRYFLTKHFEVKDLAKTSDDWLRYEERLKNFGEILEVCQRNRDNPEVLIVQLKAKIDASPQRGNTFFGMSWSNERYNNLLTVLKVVAETKPEVVVARFDELLATILTTDTTSLSKRSPTPQLAQRLGAVDRTASFRVDIAGDCGNTSTLAASPTIIPDGATSRTLTDR